MVKLKMDCPHCKKEFEAQIQEIHSPEEAREIKSQPALLEACKAVLACVNSNNITEQINNEDAEKLSNVLADIHRAISEAEGR